MTEKEMIKVMQHYVDGGDVEEVMGGGEWVKVKKPLWNWQHDEYRIAEVKKYPMCKEQPAQIDCKKTKCRFHKEATCTNIAPALTVNPACICWSFEEKPRNEFFEAREKA